MCGICGIYDSQIRHIPRAHIMNMCDTLKHRGPDDFGYWSDESIILGHRRLRVIDLKTGNQPMTNEDDSLALVVNGEIYNYQELQEGLIKKGHRFKSISDSEVILHLYEEHGDACVQYLRGMFSFALWDAKQSRLFCARDRMGQKPFFYSCVKKKGNVQCVFSSELMGLFSDGYVEKKIDQSALVQYLMYGYVLHPRTIYEGVFKLPPAHTLVIDANGAQTQQYWSRSSIQVDSSLTERKAIAGLRSVLEDATRMRMIADVPLGVFLSGGLDSSIVVALMSHLSDQRVKTFSIGFDDRRYNELGYARSVADRYKTDHTEFMVEPHMVEVVPDLVRKFGEPFADSSCVPTYYVSQLTRQHVTVALNGDGADESFAGYDRYYAVMLSERLAQMAQLLPSEWWKMLCGRFSGSADQRSLVFRARRFLEGLQLPKEKRYRRWVSRCTDFDLGQICGKSFFDQGNDMVCDLFADEAGKSLLAQLLSIDQRSYLPGDLLVKMDIASMAHGLETRSPFLDHKVVEYAWSLNDAFKLRGKTGKYILRKAFQRELPRAVLQRKKMGFGVPVGQWFRNELKTELQDRLFSAGSFTATHFNMAHVRDLVAMHVDGSWNHDKTLWSLYMLELWYEQCFKR